MSVHVVENPQSVWGEMLLIKLNLTPDPNNNPTSNATTMTKKITTIIFDVDDTLYDVSTVSSLLCVCYDVRHSNSIRFFVRSSRKDDRLSIPVYSLTTSLFVSQLFLHNRDSRPTAIQRVLHPSW